MARQLAIIGLGRFGLSICHEAMAIGHEVLAIDRDQRLVDAYKDEVSHAVRADAMNKEALEKLGLKEFDGVVVAIGSNDLANIMVSMNLKDIGIQNIISRASDEIHARVLQRVGVTRVIIPERDTGIRLAHTYGIPQVIEYLELTPDHGVSKFTVPASMVGQNIWDSGLPSDYKLTVLALIRDNEIHVNPAGLTRLQAGDTLVVVGHDDQLSQVQQLRNTTY
ncbi:MAG: TrkA family potassium uptake protein [Chloroflexi bacterium]|nr:TrkA family potassium uptake protein [Chloroflexota bacterium]